MGKIMLRWVGVDCSLSFLYSTCFCRKQYGSTLFITTVLIITPIDQIYSGLLLRYRSELSPALYIYFSFYN